MVDKELLSTFKFKGTCRHMVTTMSAWIICHHLNVKVCCGRRPRGTPLLMQRHKLKFAKTYLKKPKSSFKNVLWADEAKVVFCAKAHHSTVNRK